MNYDATNEFTRHVMLMRDAGVVKRSHTCRTLMDRNVAEHSHGVAMLALLMCQWADGSMPRPQVLAAALCHDLSEIATGDVPAPVKREHPALRAQLNAISTEWEAENCVRFDLTKDEQSLLIWCDRMDFALYALEEVTMGNRFFEEYLTRILDWLGEMPLPNAVNGMRSVAVDLYSGVTTMSAKVMNIDHEGVKL